MLDPSFFAGTIELGSILAVGFALAGAVLVGTLQLQGRRVPGVALQAAVALPVGIAVAFATWSLAGAEDLPGLAAAVANRVVVLFLVLPAAGLGLLLAAVVGAKGRPRVWWRGGVLAGLAVLMAVVSVVGGFLSGAGEFGVFRTLVLLPAGLLVAAAGLAGGEGDGTGADASAGAALAWPWVVASAEVSMRALHELLLLLQLGTVGTEIQANFLELAFREGIDILNPWSLALVGLSVVMALVGATAHLDRQRALWLLPGLMGVAGAVAILWLGRPGPSVLLEILGL